MFDRRKFYNLRQKLWTGAGKNTNGEVWPFLNQKVRVDRE